MRKNLRGRKATAIALASVMAMSLAACGKQDGSNPGGQTEQKEYVYVPEYLELDDNTNSSYSNMTVQGDKLYYTIQGLSLAALVFVLGIDFWLEALFLFRPIIVCTLIK